MIRTHPAGLSEVELARACVITRSRSSGPGGQRRNKVETAVKVMHTPTGIAAQSGESRSAEENRRRALRRLRVQLALDVRTVIDPASYVPSELLKGRTLNGRLALNPRHADFPTLLAEALDLLAGVHDDVVRAATLMGLSTSQLVRLLGYEPEALTRLNRRRKESGLAAYLPR